MKYTPVISFQNYYYNRLNPFHQAVFCYSYYIKHTNMIIYIMCLSFLLIHSANIH